METQRSYHAVGTRPPGPLQVGHAAKGLPARGLCPQPVPGQRIAICHLQHNPSQRDNPVWPLREIPEDVLMLTSGSSLSSRLFLSFFPDFPISLSITQLRASLILSIMSAFFFFFPPSNWCEDYLIRTFYIVADSSVNWR